MKKYVTVYKGVAKDIQESRIFEPKIRVSSYSTIRPFGCNEVRNINSEIEVCMKLTVFAYVCKIDR